MKRDLSQYSTTAFTLLGLFLGCANFIQDTLHASRTRPVHKIDRENPFPKSCRSLPQITSYAIMENPDADTENSYSSSPDRSDSHYSSSYEDNDFESGLHEGGTSLLSDDDRNDILSAHLTNLPASLMSHGRFNEAIRHIEKFYETHPSQKLYLLHLLCCLEINIKQEDLEKLIVPAWDVLRKLKPSSHQEALSFLISHHNNYPLEELVEEWSALAHLPYDMVKLDWLQALVGFTKAHRAQIAQCAKRLSMHPFRCGHVAKHLRYIDPPNWERAVDVTLQLAGSENDMIRAEYLTIISSIDLDRWDPFAQSISLISPYFKPAVVPYVASQIANLSPEREKQVLDTIKIIGEQSSEQPLWDTNFMTHITLWDKKRLKSLQDDLLTFEPHKANFPSIMESHITKRIFVKKLQKRTDIEKSALNNDINS